MRVWLIWQQIYVVLLQEHFQIKSWKPWRKSSCIEQFISALNSRELRLGISQTSPETLDTALQTALKLETLFAVENSKKIAEKDTEVNMAYHAWSYQTTPLEHAQINTAGSKDEKLPQCAKEMLKRQTVLFEIRLAKNERTERSRNDACYLCGQPSHFKRSFPQRFYQDNPNPGSKPARADNRRTTTVESDEHWDK